MAAMVLDRDGTRVREGERQNLRAHADPHVYLSAHTIDLL
jgi:hypothetical protein